VLPSEDDIMADVTSASSGDDNVPSTHLSADCIESQNDDREDGVDAVDLPTLSDAMSALQTVWCYLYTRDGNDAAQQHALDNETVRTAGQRRMRQTTVKDFF
jgi:hypothetical protein